MIDGYLPANSSQAAPKFDFQTPAGKTAFWAPGVNAVGNTLAPDGPSVWCRPLRDYHDGEAALVNRQLRASVGTFVLMRAARACTDDGLASKLQEIASKSSKSTLDGFMPNFPGLHELATHRGMTTKLPRAYVAALLNAADFGSNYQDKWICPGSDKHLIFGRACGTLMAVLLNIRDTCANLTDTTLIVNLLGEVTACDNARSLESLLLDVREHQLGSFSSVVVESLEVAISITLRDLSGDGSLAEWRRGACS